ncbi:hypothetical protein HY478_00565 [Candidatus Uhrbacteria bacterium]|nr:hypothetical protein [Candidatus Uhrbacteria bacterium]
MSTLTFGIATSRGAASDKVQMDAFVSEFPQGNGAVFGLVVAGRAELPDLVTLVRTELDELSKGVGTDTTLFEAHFEQSIGTLNDRVAAFFTSNAGAGRADVHAVLGGVTAEQLLLTGTGNLLATFLRKEKSGTYHVFDLLKNLREDVDETTRAEEPDKIFGALVTGEMRAEDTLGITTPGTRAVVGDEQWKRALATMAPPQTGGYIRHMLSAKSSPGIALVIRHSHLPAHDVSVSPSPDTSIAALRSTEHTTQKLLGGASGISIIHFIKRGAHALLDLVRGSIGRIDPRRRTSTKKGEPRQARQEVRERRSALRTFGGGIRAIWLFLIGILGAVIHLLRGLFAALRGRDSRRKYFHESREATGRMGDFLVGRFNALPRVSKLLLVAALVFIVLFAQSILYLGYRRRVQNAQAAYLTAVSDIERLRTDAEASLIYRDEAEARALLLSAQEKIAELPRDSRGKRKTTERLSNEIQTALIELRHEIIIDPQIIRRLESPPPANSFAYRLTLYDEAAATSTVIGTSTYEDRTVALHDDGAIDVISESGERTPLELTVPGEVLDAELFGTRLYILAPTVPQIYRLGRAGQSFANLTPWLREGGELIRQSRDLAIDGAIYALSPTSIIKFFAGVTEEWAPYIEPVLEDATKIWTSDEVQGIYILEPSRRRIVVLDKPGVLLAQYIFPEGTELRDFAVDEANKKLAVVNADHIEEIDLAHLTAETP